MFNLFKKAPQMENPDLNRTADEEKKLEDKFNSLLKLIEEEMGQDAGANISSEVADIALTKFKRLSREGVEGDELYEQIKKSIQEASAEKDENLNKPVGRDEVKPEKHRSKDFSL